MNRRSDAPSVGSVSLVGRLVDTGAPARVHIEDGVITQLSGIDPGEAEPDVWLAPGLCDIQINGYGGYDVNAEDVHAETIADLVRSQWALGVTTICPTVITGAEERIVHALRAIEQARRSDPLVEHSVPCAHVEGPHVAGEDGPRGAHDARWLRPPDLAEFARWQQAADDLVGIVTLAPELPGATDYICALAGAGVIVGIGHTAAEPAAITAAVDAGARLSTHLGNAAHATIRRHPNYIWEQLAEDRLAASFIADSHHLPASVLKVMLRGKGVQRSILVSDATALAGMPPGSYDTPIGGRVELSADGRLSLAESPLLAGAARPLPACVAWTAESTGVGLAAAVRMATANPANLIHTPGPPRGQLRVGGAGDAITFRTDPATGQLSIDTTVVGGIVVHRSGL